MLTLRTTFSILLFLPFGFLSAQDTLTLETCYSMAGKNWPLVSQLDLLAGSTDLKIKNLGKNFLPQVSLNAGASYQSDVTQFNITLPEGMPAIDFPEMKKDIYKATLDVSQMIYDGHVTGYNKKLEKANLEVETTTVRSELYKLKDRVNQLYFTIILLKENERILVENRERVEAKLKEARVGVQNGAVLQMNADVLEAELARIEQQTDESRGDRQAACSMLAVLIGGSVDLNTVLVMPSPVITSYAFENKRLEDQVFSLQASRLGLMSDMVTTKWNPRLYAYGQAGYGRPGLNMLDPDFAPWGLIGAKFTWNFWNWNSTKNEKKILGLQQEIVRSQQSAFDQNLRILAGKDLAEIEKAETVLKKDAEIITLRERITRAASSQLDNGVITSSDYVARLKEESQARLNYEIHKIQAVKARLNYLYNQGKL